MAKPDVPRRRDPQEPKPRAARISLAHSLMQFLEGVVDVRKPVMLILERIVEILGGELRELIENVIEPTVPYCVTSQETWSPERTRPRRIPSRR